MKTIYLSGPMSECDDTQMLAWRKKVITGLHGYPYQFHNPIVRDFRTGYDRDKHEKFIVDTDLQDIWKSDIVLVNAWKPSFGTPMEMVYSRVYGKRTLTVIPPTVFKSPWLTYHSTEVFEKIEHVIALLRYEARWK